MTRIFAHQTLVLTRTVAISAAALTLMAGVACAQKSKDTLRVAVTESIAGVDGLYFAGFDGFITNKIVQDTLIYWDTVEKRLKPQLATEWKRLDANTIDFKLRQGVEFHNGQELTADDVVYTFQIATDPKYKFRLKERNSVVKNVEKLDKYSVRLHLNQGSGVDLINLSAYPPILPAAAHAKYENKADFARETVGTGPYRLTSLDSNGGVVFEKSPTYNWGGSAPAGRIGKITLATIGDKQTQIAKVLVGELDMIFDVDVDLAKRVTGSNPDYRIHVAPSAGFFFLNFDTANRSGQSPFGDKRLREAVLSAIDFKTLYKTYVPKMEPEQILSSMCHPVLAPCTPDLPQKLPDYDPARAKRLLAEAGRPNGFDVEILTWSPSKVMTEAVAGELRKVGIRAIVNNVVRSVFTKLRGDGKAVMQLTIWDNGGEPDIDRTANYFFGQDIPQNYVQSPELAKLVDQGRDEIDPAKRRQIYDKLFGIANAERYIAPVAPAASLIVHHKDLTIDNTPIIYGQGFAFNRMGWVK